MYLDVGKRMTRIRSPRLMWSFFQRKATAIASALTRRWFEIATLRVYWLRYASGALGPPKDGLAQTI